MFVSDVELRQTLQEDYLKHMPDFLRVVKKFLSQKAKLQVCVCACMRVCASLHPLPPPQDCVQVYNAVKRLHALANVLRIHEGHHKCLLQEMFEKPVEACELGKWDGEGKF